MAWLINRPARFAWVAAVRFLAQVGAGIKAASTAEDLLNIRLQNLFNKVNAEVASQIEKRGGNIPGVMRNAVQPMADIIYNEIRKPGMSPRVEAQLRDYAFQASKRTIDRMTGNVMESLSKAYADGLGTYDAADRISKDFKDMAGWELQRVARTEVNSAQNQNNFDRMAQAGVAWVQWWTAEDERVRETPQANHRVLHGQIVRRGNQFSNGLKFPGDRSTGALAEFINCRCTGIPFIMPQGYVAPGDGSQPFYEADLIPIQPTSTAVEILNDEIRGKNATQVADKLVFDGMKGKGPKWTPDKVNEMVQQTVRNFNSEISNGFVEGLDKVRFGAKLPIRVGGRLEQGKVLGQDVLKVGRPGQSGPGTFIHELAHSIEHNFGVTRGTYGYYGEGRLMFDKLSPKMQDAINELGDLAKEAYKRQLDNVRSVIGEKEWKKLYVKKEWYFKLPNKNYDILTPYSLSREEEFFAEAVKIYKINPNVLARLHPKLFNAIRDTLFDGRGF